jgi:1-acyl-sn-glycerol-3-phosphate acyltransferase
MITDILYRCPACGGFDWFDGQRCILCNSIVRILSRSELVIGGERNTIAHWYRKVLAFDLPESVDGTILKSSSVVLSREATKGTYKGFGGIVATHFTRSFSDEGGLTLKAQELVFSGQKETILLPFGDLAAVTIESNTIIVISREHGVLFLDFRDQPGKKWEDCIRKSLAAYHAPRKIGEFYPRLRFEDGFKDRPSGASGHTALQLPVRKWYDMDTSIPFSVVRTIAKPLIKAVFSVDIQGLENIPGSGAAVLLSNHTSFLDSIILGVFPKRHIWFMAKNSEYKGPLLTWALRHARSFPVRRYTIDVQAVRNAIRVVQQGHILGIYPEGERTWDNTLLPFRQGTMRLILALGKPIIPVGISGAYELMPRWESSIKRSLVKIRIGEPFLLAHIPIPRQTRSDISQAKDILHNLIVNLLGEGH